MFLRLAQVASLMLLTSAASPSRRATTCNGYSELCDVSYGNYSMVGTHDSYAVGTNNLAVNQDYDITQQLTDGVRLLQVQTHNLSGVIQLCHTSCSLYNGGTFQSYLGKVKTWMDSNTEDVVSILIVNNDNFDVSAYATIFEAAGLSSLAYSPPTSSVTAASWPTLGSMISNGTRLVVFMDTQADFTTVPYIIDEFSNVWETAYDVTTTTFDCAVNRTTGDTSTQLYLINHFLDQVVLGQPAPDVSAANETNSVNGTGGLGIQVATCEAEYGRAPNFLLVDFYEYGGGSVFEVAASINGVKYAPTSPIATPVSSSTSSSSSGSGNSALPHFSVSWGSLVAVVTSIVFGATLTF